MFRAAVSSDCLVGGCPRKNGPGFEVGMTVLMFDVLQEICKGLGRWYLAGVLLSVSSIVVLVDFCYSSFWYSHRIQPGKRVSTASGNRQLGTHELQHARTQHFGAACSDLDHNSHLPPPPPTRHHGAWARVQRVLSIPEPAPRDAISIPATCWHTRNTRRWRARASDHSPDLPDRRPAFDACEV